MRGSSHALATAKKRVRSFVRGLLEAAATHDGHTPARNTPLTTAAISCSISIVLPAPVKAEKTPSTCTAADTPVRASQVFLGRLPANS